MVLQLALRNVRRNVVRTGLTLLGIAVALALMFTSMALENGAWNGMISAAIQSGAGHVVVQRDGWQKERDAELWLADSGVHAAAMREAYPEATVLRRTFLGGLLTSPTGSAAVTVQGIEPELEATVTLLDDKLADGAWLDDDRGILLGDRLADALGVALDDKVVLMAQVGTDEMESRLFRVKGLFHTGNDVLDAYGAMATLTATQSFLPGPDAAHQVAVVLPNAGGTLVDPGPAEAGVAGCAECEVLPWNRALPTLEEQRELDASFSRLLYFFMGLIVSVGVLNTVLMSVMERMKEFGVMLAVGTRPRWLATMILLEGFFVGMMGAAGGLLLSILPIGLLTVYGLDYGDLMNSASPVGNVPIDTVIRGQANVGDMLTVAGIAVFMSVLATLIPARKAFALHPVEAITHL